MNVNPWIQFKAWFDEAVAAKLPLPEAMTLATATADGKPSARQVLFKGIVRDGLAFYTNYESRKAKELLSNPQAALVFHWAAQERQIRVDGAVEKTTAAESDAYWRTRPRESQIGAWASRQSSPIADRETLEKAAAELERKYSGRDIPRPEFWGGFRLIPEEFEFWEGRPGRIHDRFLYTQDGKSGWKITRLAP